MKMWTKQPFTQLGTGWLSTSRDWYPCEYMEHLALAGYLCEDKEVSDRYAEEELLKTGWCEVQVMTFMEHGFLFNFERHLTPEQVRVIKPVAEADWDRILRSNQYDLMEEFER